MDSSKTHIPSTLPFFRSVADQEIEHTELIVDADGRTDVGCVRAINEDQFLIADLKRQLVVERAGLDPGALRSAITCGKLLVVADGLGGHGGGDIASAVALDELTQQFAYTLPWIDRPGSREVLKALQKAFWRCQARVESVAAHKGIADQRPGTTLTVASFLGSSMYLVHAGDSRCYVHRDGALYRLTTDHTLGQRLYGEYGNEATGSVGPFDHVLLNVIGGGSSELYADLKTLPLHPGDVILLCTDGLTRHLSDNDIASHIERTTSASECCDALIDAAKREGGMDNITVVTCRVCSVGPREA